MQVLIVEDHPIVRDAYRMMLEQSGWVTVVAEADCAEAGYQAYQAHRPDVVIMDINMPGAGGLDGVRRITRWDPKARVLVFSMHEEESYRAMALQAGALNYVNKRSSPGEMMDAIWRAARERGGDRAAEDPATEQPVFEKLSLREFEVFRLLAGGHSVQQVAETLGISPNTAGVHKTRIMKKLGADNAAQLTLLAIRHGVIQT